MNGDLLRVYRSFLKDTVRLEMDFSQTDQSRGVPPPPIEKPYPRTRSGLTCLALASGGLSERLG